MPGRSPTVRRRRLANELRRLRDEAGLTIEEVAAALECSDSKISRIETARVRATTRDVRDMLALYNVDGTERDMLMSLAREARQKAWWHEYRLLLNTALVGLETEASAVHTYVAQVLPGLLQTEDYARAVLTAALPKHDSNDIERRVRLRMDRKVRLEQPDPLTIWAVIDEAALRRPVGGAAVMRRQVAHLAEVADLPTITLQVIPFGAGAHAGMDGGFTLIKFPDPSEHDVVYLENTWQDTFLEEEGATRLYSLLFDYLRAAALDPAASKALFPTIAKEY